MIAENRGAVPSAELAPATLFLIVTTWIIGLSVLAGWFTGNPWIAGSFSHRGIFMQPWTAIGCIALAASFLCAATGRNRLARLLAAIPLTIALIALMQEWLGVSLAPDQTPFLGNIPHQSSIRLNKTGMMPAFSILLLTLASLGATFRRPMIRGLITGLACLVFSLALFSAILGLSPLAMSTRHALMTVPTASSLIAISSAIILQRRHMAWPRDPICTPRDRALEWILVPCLILPVISVLWQLWAYRSGQLTLEMAAIIQVSGQIVLTCAIMTVAWVMIVRVNTARWALSAAMDSASVAITDIDGRIVHWSKGCERLYGWTAAEAATHSKHQLTDALLPLGPTPPPISDFPQETEIMEHRRDGARLHILESRQIVQPGPGIAPMVVLSMTDITGRQRAEQAKLASEARLAFAADLHELGLFEWTAATDRIQLSPHAERLFRLEPGAFNGGMEEWREHIRRHFGSDILLDEPSSAFGSDRRSFQLRSPDTPPLVVEGSIFFHERPGDRGVSMLGIIMNATEREKRTEMLKAREFELRSILETVPEAMITVDTAERVRSFSTAAEKLFGYTAEEITGCDVRMLLPDYRMAKEDSPPTFRACTKASTGRDRYGNAMPVELVIGKTTIGREDISIAFVRSLQEQIATQTRLDELREQLLHASRVSAMGEMGAGLAHELNQPLTAAANFLGAAHLRLGIGSSPDQLRELMEMANSEVLRAGEIIRRMRAFVARGEPDIRALSLNDLIADALQLAWSGAHMAGVHLHYLPSDSAPMVLADHIQIQQVFVNIINNALESFSTHGTEKPEIIIHAAEQAKGDVLIRLVDNGPGFPPSIIDRPFEAFASTRPKGLGLGLSICRRIVECHGGALTFSNRPEGGAVIEFTLPVYRDSDLGAAE